MGVDILLDFFFVPSASWPKSHIQVYSLLFLGQTNCFGFCLKFFFCTKDILNKQKSFPIFPVLHDFSSANFADVSSRRTKPTALGRGMFFLQTFGTSINPHCFIGDGHQLNRKALYISIIRIPNEGWMTTALIDLIATFDHATFEWSCYCFGACPDCNTGNIIITVFKKGPLLSFIIHSYPPVKLTWQWKVPVFKKEYISSTGPVFNC